MNDDFFRAKGVFVYVCVGSKVNKPLKVMWSSGVNRYQAEDLMARTQTRATSQREPGASINLPGPGQTP